MTLFSVRLGHSFLRVILPRGFTSAELLFTDQSVPDEATLLGRVEALKTHIENLADRINTHGVRGDFDLSAVMAALGESDYGEVPVQIEPILLRTSIYHARSYTPHSGSGFENLQDQGCFIVAFRFDGTPTLDLYALAAFVTIPDRHLVFYRILRDGEGVQYFVDLAAESSIYDSVMRNVWRAIDARY